MDEGHGRTSVRELQDEILWVQRTISSYTVKLQSLEEFLERKLARLGIKRSIARLEEIERGNDKEKPFLDDYKHQDAIANSSYYKEPIEDVPKALPKSDFFKDAYSNVDVSLEEARRLSVLDHLRHRFDYAPISELNETSCARCGLDKTNKIAQPCGCVALCDACYEKHLYIQEFGHLCPRCGNDWKHWETLSEFPAEKGGKSLDDYFFDEVDLDDL